MRKMLHVKALVSTKSVGATQPGVIDEIIGSTPVIDRMGDTIEQEGWDLKSFKENPVILWGHNMDADRPAIGKALKVWIEGKGKDAKLKFKVQFDLADEFAASIYRKIKEGFINAVSVGFMPTEYEEIEPGNFWGGLKYLKQQLLELSFVTVPANPEALVGLRSFAKSDKRFTPVESEEKLYPPVKNEAELKELLAAAKATDIDVDPNSTVDEEGNVTGGNGGGGDNDKIEDKPDGSVGERPPYEATEMLGNITVGNFRDEMNNIAQQCMPNLMGKAKKAQKDDAGTGDLDLPPKDPFQAGQGMGDLAEMPPDNMQVKDMTVGHTRTMMGDVFGDWQSNLDTTSNESEDDVNDYAFTDADTKADKLRKAKGLVSLVEKAGRVLSGKNENKIKNAIALLNEVISELEKEEETENGTDGKAVEGEETKGVIGYTNHGKSPEGDSWDASGEMAKATEPADWKAMCAWFDSSAPDNKGSYKLPHHKGDAGHPSVWRGVAAAMAALLGARGGVDIPEGDRKGVYNHLVKHYKEYDKEAPDFKAVEDQVLAGYTDEIFALILDREEKHMVRLIKRVLENQKEEKKDKADGVPQVVLDPKELEIKVLAVFESALTKVSSIKEKGGDK